MTNADDMVRHESAADMGGDLDAELQRELDEALGDMSLMDLDVGDAPTAGGEPGDEDVRKGTVVAIQRDHILIDMGDKCTGVLPAKQLADEPLPAIGD